MARKQVALAKISRPRLHDVLARTRLFTVLDKAAKRPVIWLCAQPGAGKTTLVASYLQARKRPGIWYQVDAADADAASFIYHLRLAAQTAATLEPPDLPLLTPEYLQDLPGCARRFFRNLFAGLGCGALLVLDNFQEVPEESAFHGAMVEGMQQVPDGISVVVISRIEPPVRYAPLLASDAIAVLDGEQLRLTLPETKAIAHKRGVTGDAAVEVLQERSNGWAAGLTLLLTRTRRDPGLHEDDDADSLQHVFGYFAQRVFDAAAPEHQRALMQLAVLPLITVTLAEQLTGMADVGRLLDQFYKRHLFTDRRRVAAIAAQAQYVFQVHALFRTFLRHQARISCSAEQLRDITCRAGRLLDAAGHWEEALGLYAEAGDWGAYAVLMAEHAEGLLEQSRRQTVIDWLGRMPEGWLDRDPWLGYWEGRALMESAPDRALQTCSQRTSASRPTATPPGSSPAAPRWCRPCGTRARAGRRSRRGSIGSSR